MGGKKQRRGKGDLGNSLVKSRFKGQRTVIEGRETGLLHTSDLNDDISLNHVGKVSVTEQGDLQEFLATAELAGTDFTAERLNVRVVDTVQNEALPSKEKRKMAARAQEAHGHMLRIPRRPNWTKEMTADELQQRERESFLTWRRSLAELQEIDNILLTPFERNLDFWRQLWRVIERSDVVVQIVDARNPLLFRCRDLEDYVREVDSRKKSVILVNKADFLSEEQRQQWVDYFTSDNTYFVFFSALEESEKQQQERRDEDEEDEDDEGSSSEFDDDDDDDDDDTDDADDDQTVDEKKNVQTQHSLSELDVEDLLSSDEDAQGDSEFIQPYRSASNTTVECTSRTQSEDQKTLSEQDGICQTVEDDSEAESYLKQHKGELYNCEMMLHLFRLIAIECKAKLNPGDYGYGRTPTIGLVGYPNVGKSSTINALCKAKKVSVSATPGKTKHYQTLVLGDIVLCDCPGLVFPNFANTKAELVCNGILPVDQLRDVIPPATHVCHTIPRDVLENTYGIHIIKPAEDDPDPERPPTAAEFLHAYSYARGFMNARGMPDIQRGARRVLKDYVNGKLLFCASPPGYKQLMSAQPGIAFQPKASTALVQGSNTSGTAFHEVRSVDSARLAGPAHHQTYTNEVDEQFFHQHEVKAITKGVRSSSSNTRRPDLTQPMQLGSKKHFKKNRKQKTRKVAVTGYT